MMQVRGYNGPLFSAASSAPLLNPKPLVLARETVERIQTLGTVSVQILERETFAALFCPRSQQFWFLLASASQQWSPMCA